MAVIPSYKGMKVSVPKDCTTSEKTEEAVLDALTDLYDINVPQSRVDNEVKAMTLELYQKLHYEALCSGIYNYHIQQDIQEQMDTIKTEAYRQVKLEIILQHIIKDEQLDISEEELAEEAAAIARRQNTSLDMMKDFLGSDFGMLKSDLLIRKAINLICSNAVLVLNQPI